MLDAQPGISVHDDQQCRKTRGIYDLVAPLYPLSSALFHSKAHRLALGAAAIEDGSRVLEVAIGSGEMLRQLVRANPRGQTVGVDLSPRMAAQAEESAKRTFPKANLCCQAADARYLPYPDGSFDAVMCCYLFELLPAEDFRSAVEEIRRVLRPGGRLTLILVGQDRPSFNALYKLAGNVAPAFWGRQVSESVAVILNRSGFRTDLDRHVRQIFYSSRIVSATR